MASFEQVVLDCNGASPLTLVGDDSAVYRMEELDLGLAQRRPQWISGDEGAALVEDPPYDDATLAVTLRVFPSSDTMDAALAAVQALTLKLQECSASGPDGVACSYTAANSSTTYTFYAKLGEYDGPPAITPSGELAGWFINKPVLKFKLTRKPFFYGPENGTVTEAFGSNTIANFTADNGATTNVSITGGVMQASANLTTENRLIRTTGTTYTDLYDSQGTVKATLGTTLSGFKAGVVLKRVSANTMLAVYLDDNGTNSRLRIDKIAAGTATNLATVNLAVRMTTSSSHWLRGRINGNVLVAEHFTSAPAAGSTVADTTTATLTTGDITTYGVGVSGKSGLIFTPQQAAASLDDWAVAPNVTKFSTPMGTMVLPGVPGDVAAEARFIVEDWAAQARRYIEWGQQWRYTDTATLLQLDTFTALGASSTTRAGSYNTNVYRGTLTTSPSALVSTGNLGHVGSFRVRARVYASSATVYVGLSWSDGSGIPRTNDYALVSQSGGWSDVDLGTISISPATLGTQQWSGRIVALSSTASDTLDVDFVQLFPNAEGYTKARAPITFETPNAFLARDEFNQTAGNLAGKALPSGGVWSVAGASATDFTVDATNHWITRSTATEGGAFPLGGKYALAPTAATATLVQTSLSTAYPATSPSSLDMCVVARYTDTSNFVAARFEPVTTTSGTILVSRYVAGVLQPLGNVAVAWAPTPNLYKLRLAIETSGRWYVWFWPASTALPTTPILAGSNTALATGGALASGLNGIYDVNGSGSVTTRYYDDFFAAVPADTAVIFAGKQAELRSDGAIRQDASSIWGPVPSRYGSNFYVPPAGAENRSTRIATRTARNDLDSGAAYDNPSGDNLQAQVVYTPRFLLPK